MTSEQCKCHISDLEDLPEFSSSNLGYWWNSTERYTSSRFQSSWNSRRPRAECADLIDQLRQVFLADKPWNPNVVTNVTQLLLLNVPPAKQFPRRILRSTIHKLTVAINRQLLVMNVSPEKSSAFEDKARIIMLDLLDKLEVELYQLCDSVEALPIS